MAFYLDTCKYVLVMLSEQLHWRNAYHVILTIDLCTRRWIYKKSLLPSMFKTKLQNLFICCRITRPPVHLFQVTDVLVVMTFFSVAKTPATGTPILFQKERWYHTIIYSWTFVSRYVHYVLFFVTTGVAKLYHTSSGWFSSVQYPYQSTLRMFPSNFI